MGLEKAERKFNPPLTAFPKYGKIYIQINYVYFKEVTMKQKKRLLMLLALACALTSGLALSSCKDNEVGSQPTQIELVYREYVAYAEENGQTPLSYEQWLESIKGDKGEDGVDGKDGVGIEKVEYDENGDLKITFTNGITQTVAMPEKEEEGTYGLQYQRIAGKDEYRVVGIGIASELDIVIPDTYNGLPVTEISEAAFKGSSSYLNRSLTSVSIGNNVVSIGNSAFYQCENLTSVTLGESITSIGNSVFSNCSNLTSIEMPDGVTSIGSSTFYSCTKLINVRLGKNITEIPASIFAGCYALTDVTIPEGVTAIKASAFEGCESLTSIIIPNGVTSIGNYAFSSCDGLMDIVIPDSVTSIANGAFNNCLGLIKATVGENVNSISNAAFYGCIKLVEIYNKSSLNITLSNWDNGNIAYYAKNVYTPTSGESKISTDENGYILYNGDELVSLIGYIGEQTDLILPNSITEIQKYAFYRCGVITSVNIPNSITSIGEGAFFECKNLTSISIPDTVTSIGNAAFYSCENLKNITIPNGVTSIGEAMFYDCKGLTSIIIPDSVTLIEGRTFVECSKLTSITFTGTIEQWNTMQKDSYWNSSVPATEVVCSDGTVAL